VECGDGGGGDGVGVMREKKEMMEEEA